MFVSGDMLKKSWVGRSGLFFFVVFLGGALLMLIERCKL